MIQILLAYAVGHLLLFVSCFVIWRWFHRTPNLAKRLEVVREYVNRRRRVDRARLEIERARAEHTGVQKLLARVRQLVAERIEMVDSATYMISAVSFAIVTFILFEGDAGLLTLLNGGSAVFGLPLGAWAFFAPWIAAAIFIFLHMLLHMAIADDDRPSRTLKRARLGAVILGLIVALGFWGTLSGRGVDFTQAGWAPDIILWGLWVLTLALGVCGAFTSIVAVTSYAQARIPSQLVALERIDEEYRTYIKALTDEITTHMTANPSEAASMAATRDGLGTPPSTSPAQVSSIISGIVLLLTLTAGVSTMTGEPLHGNPTTTANSIGGSHRGTPSWVSRVAVPAADECEILIDVSGSMGDDGRRLAADAFVSMIAPILDAYRCRVLRLSAFSGDAPFQPIHEFIVPAVPVSASAACATAIPAIAGMSGAARFIYPALAERDQHNAHTQCRERVHAEEARARSARAPFLNDIVTAVHKLSRAPARGACTAIYQAAARAVQRSAHVVVVTDGASTCRWYRQPDGSSLSIPTSASSLVFLLVPTAAERETGGDGPLTRGILLKTVFPDASVELLNEATPAFWRKVVTPPPAK